MRIAVLVVLAGMLAGCVSLVGEPSAAPTDPPVATAAATPTPTPSPAATATATSTPPTPTPAEPTPDVSADPNATPTPTAVDLLPYLSSEITVVNLGDNELSVTVTLVDADSDDEFEVGTFGVQPMQVTTQLVVAARLRLEFDFTGGGDNEAGTCTIDIADAEQIQFAAIETGVIITAGSEPEDPAELVVATSSRCNPGEAT